ncbi:MAG: zinc-dependent metalloprotease [Bacteroidota bacterium]
MRTLTVLLLVLAFQAHGQFFQNNKNVIPFKGYFNFYYDNATDNIYLEVDKLDTEFLYVHALSEGLGSNDIGLDRGQLGDGIVVTFKKAGNKLLLIQPNQNYRAITDNEEERKSIKEAFAKSVIHGFMVKEQKNGVYLVDATAFFMRDAHGIANRLRQNKQGNYSLDTKRSAFYLARTKAFPKNVEFDVMLTFKGEPKGYQIRSVTPDASAVTVHQHHSFVELPDGNYKPRVFDPRSGSFPMSYLDYATPVNEPIVKRFIYRHRLEKKDPSATVSEAKESIVYYLDRGAPEPVRSALLEGARWWNEAFEAIGYKDAFQVKMLPEDADPMDLRYNVIQWVHRSTRGWSYGSNISDPRTGEILKGHVSLGSLRIRQDFMIAQALQAPYAGNDTGDQFALEMALARIRQLSAHEVGHTLGFAHNFAASVNDRASVMDYPHPRLTLKADNSIDFSEAYATGIGEWDKVTVAYSYQNFPNNEALGLKKILENAFAKGLRYISDSDARPKGGAHAYAHLWDNGTDATAELERVLAVRKAAIDRFSVDNIKSSVPYSVLEDVFVPLYFFHRYQTEAAVKLIGGLDYSYAVKGGDEVVVKRVPPSIQQKALEEVLKTIDVETVKIPHRILELFPPRAMGYGRTRESFKSKVSVAFDPLGAAETAAQMTMELLFHPERASRIVQHKGLDANQKGLDEVIDRVIAHTFKKAQKDSYDTELQNTINFVVLQHLMHLAVSPGVYRQVNAIAAYKLDELEQWLAKRKSKGLQRIYDKAMWKAIQNFKTSPGQFKLVTAPKIPDGSPIGME